MMAPANVSTTSLIATLNSGFAWPAGPITFSIPTAASLWPGYGAGGEPFRPGYAPPPTEMAPQIRLAMQRWDELIAPALLEVTEPGAQGQLRVAFTDLGEDTGSWGYAYYPTSGSSAVAGDVWIDPSHRGESFAPETYNFQALLHELGHALGLKHPFETPNILAAEYDTQRHTLMSYTQAQDRFVPSFTVTQTSPTSSSIRASYNPVVIAGPQLLDVLAIQAIYGADPTTRAGDTTYSFDPAIASIQTIYDAGGTDTWDLSASTRRSLIDLREGAFSSVNQFSVAAQIEASLAQVGESWRGFVTSVYSDSRIHTWDDNVSIAYGTIIENLRLGSAGDHAIGNAARNALSGHDGNDTLLGEGGHDSLEGGGGDDSLVGGAGDDTISGGSGSDVAVFTGARAQYSVTRHAGTGIVTVRDDTAHRDGTDLLQADVETLRFSDGEHLSTSFPGVVTVLFIDALSANEAEGNAGMTNFTFIVSRTGDIRGAASAAWAVTGSGANPATGADFAHATLPSGMVSFADGEASQTVTIQVLADSTVEPDEGFAVTLSAPVGAMLGTAGATGTIRNDDARIDIAYGARFIPTGPRSEGNAGSTPFYFTAFRSGDTSREASVDWTISGSVDGLDFTGFLLPSGTLRFYAGQSELDITVNVDADNVIEPDESFTLTLSAPVGASIGVASASATIRNDDFRENLPPTLGIAALSPNKAEGNSGVTPFTFIVARKGATTSEVSASWTISPGWGVNGADFAGGVMPSGTVSFAVNQTIQTITINVVGDGLVEADERFSVLLSSPINAVLRTASADATIRSDDTSIVAPVLAIAAVDADKPEGNAGFTPFTFTVTRTGDLTGVSNASWAVTGNGATASDFPGGVLPSGTVSFVGSQTNTTITVNVAGDTLTEANEGFTVALSAPTGATLGMASATGTIRNDDTLTITGTAGPDTLTGTRAHERLLGLGDNDLLDGGLGDDTLEGGPGEDTLLAGVGNDSLIGGEGIDTLLFGRAFAAVDLNLSLASGAIALPGGLMNFTGIENATGNGGHDQFFGDALANGLDGGNGNDTLRGGEGHDSLTGGGGVDRFEVDAGTDTITDLGRGGADALRVFAGAAANAVLFADWTATAASIADGTANLTAHGFDVDLSAAAPGLGRWNLSNAGHAEAVRLIGSVQADLLIGGGGDDHLSGGGGEDTISGGEGDDWIGTSAGHAILTGGPGSDRFGVGAGTITITDLGVGDGEYIGEILQVYRGGTAYVTLTVDYEAPRWVTSEGLILYSENWGQAYINAAGFNVSLYSARGDSGWNVSNLGSSRAVALGGSTQDDTLTGGLGHDRLGGYAGNDLVRGDAGNDTLYGNSGVGRSTLEGGAGHDVLLGWEDLEFSDSLVGGAGNDTMTGGGGADRFNVDAGTDTILDLGFGGTDLLVVSAGATAHATLAAAWTASANTSNAGVVNITAGGFGVNLAAAAGLAPGLWTVTNAGHATAVTFTGSLLRDRLTGGLGADSLVGGLGDDTLTGGDGADTLNGGAGVDSLVGGLGDDRLTGGQQVDRFLVEAGTDTLTDLGLGGNDVLVVQAGATALVTMGGHWTPSASSSNAGTASVAVAGFNVNLASVGGASGWALSNAHARAVNLVGSAQADTITGGIGADKLRGHGGADSLEGGAGNDQLWGGAGNDTMTGGAGIDRFSVDFGTDVITDFGAGGADVVIVSAGATLQATLAADWTATQASINGGVANLTAAGFDVNLQHARGISGWNVSNAGDPNAVRLTGSLRSDTLTGGAGDDWLNPLGTYGGGNEVLDGGAGADTLIGTHGSRLTGGSSADIFVFDSVYSMHSSVITDFNAAEGDILDLRSVDADSWEEERQPLVFIGSQSFTMVDVIGGETFTYHIRYAMRFEDGWLQFDLDADGVAEYEMQLVGATALGAGLLTW